MFICFYLCAVEVTGKENLAKFCSIMGEFKIYWYIRKNDRKGTEVKKGRIKDVLYKNVGAEVKKMDLGTVRTAVQR